MDAPVKPKAAVARLAVPRLRARLRAPNEASPAVGNGMLSKREGHIDPSQPDGDRVADHRAQGPRVAEWDPRWRRWVSES